MSIPRWKKEDTLKIIPWCQRQSGKSLRRSSFRGIRLWLCYNSRRYQRRSPKQRYVLPKRLPKRIMQIGTTCQHFNISNVYVSSLLPSTRTSFNIDQINEAIKELCHKKIFVFIDHQNITSNDLWVDGIHLKNSGKAILARDFVDQIDESLCQNYNFQRSIIR